MKPRAVIHIDIDAFFASLEMKRRPEAAGRPVIVGGRGPDDRRGVVSSASYEARARGVRAGMPLVKARKLCPEALFLPVDYGYYEEVSERFMSIVRETGLTVETFGLDEAYIEVSAGGRTVQELFSEAVKIASALKRRVKNELGLSCSAGIGSNKLVAKMASEAAKPGGLVVVRPGETARFLEGLPVRRLPGVGPGTERRLKALGIETIGQLARTPAPFLQREFGPVRGKTLNLHARGIDNSEVVSFHEPRSMQREVTFEVDTADRSLVRETLYALTEDVWARLRASGRKCSSVAIKVRYSDFRTITRSETLDGPTDSLGDIWPAVLSLLERVDLEGKVRLVGVKLAGLA